ncbi:uncharacterized protein LOC5563601 isoform X2 [Aedes aegypti]|nr:uncharacterized protein LOC5563601 isoform X2 [Aedes aegypti]
MPFENLPIVIVQPLSQLSQAINLGCSVFIIEENVMLHFLDQYILAHNEAEYRSSSKYFLIVIHSTGGSQAEILRSIQNHPVTDEVPNMLVVVQKNASFELLTLKFVGNGPTSSEYQLLDRYDAANHSFIYGNELFPDKLDNLEGKTSRVASFDVVPWVMLLQEDEGNVRYNNQSYTLDGMDGYLLTQFCLRYNCTWELQVDQKNLYGKVFNDGTGNGIFGALLDRKVDFAIGAVGAYYSTFKYFSITQPLQWVGVTCLVPRPRLVPYWKLVFLIFTKSVWLILGVTFMTLSVCIYIFNKPTADAQLNGFMWIFFKVLKSFVLTSSDLPRNNTPLAITVASLLMFTIIVGNTYIGKIHSTLAFPPYQNPISTVWDLARSGIKLNGEHASWMYSLDLSENQRDKIILSNFHVPPAGQLAALINKGQEATMIAVLQNGHSMVGSWINAWNVELYRIMSEPLYFEFEAGYATKTWPLLDRFSYFSSWIRDACLFKYIELIEVDRYMDHSVQVSIEHSRDRPHSQLKNMKVEEISGALLILGIGAVVSAMVFCLEVNMHSF